MNKIYKVIWSKVKNCYVVVSEIAKGQGKSSKGAEISLRAMLCAMSLVGATMAFPTSYVEAADNVTGAGTGVTIGTGSSTNGSSDVAIGRDAKTDSDASVAIGYNTQTYATDGVALGHNARSGKAGSAINNNAVAIGNGSIGEGQSSLALGNNSWALGTGGTALGNSSRSIAEKATAIGNNSYAAGANSFAMGQEALSAGFGSSALGPSSFVNGNNSVAVGSNAKIGWLTINRAGGAAANLPGATDAQKQIIGYTEDTQVKNAAAIGYMAAAYTDGSAAVGQGATAGSLRSPGTKHALALGGYAQAYALNSIAIGSADAWDANDKADDTTTTRASGNNSIAIGTNARSDKENGIALGTRTKATNINSISVGVGNVVNGANSGIFGGSNSKAGYPVLRPNIVDGADTYIIGNNNGTVKAYRSMAFGNNNNLETPVEGIHILGNNNKVTLQGGTVIGNFSEVTATDSVVIGNNAKVSHDNSVAIGSNSTTEDIVSTPNASINGQTYNFAGGEAKATVSVGANEVAGAAGDGFKHYYRTITNVAAGRISDTSTDAINGSQLYAVEKEVSKGLDFAGDNGLSINKKLGQQIDIVGGADPSQLTDNNIGVNNDNGKLKVQLAKNIVLGTDGSLSAGNTIIDNTGITTNGGVTITDAGINAGNKSIANVASGGTTDTNAANIGDVKNISKDAADQAVTNATFGLTAEDSQAVTNNVNKTVKVVGDNQAIETEIDGDKLVVALKDDMNVGQAGPNGKDGSIGVNGKDGSAVVINGKDGSIGAKGADGISGVAINGKDGSIGLTGANGKDATIKVADPGQPTLDGTPTERIEVNNHQVATMDDGLKFAGDDAQGSDKSKVIAKKLNNTVDIIGGADSTKLTDNNIGVNNDNGKLKVQLAKNIVLGTDGSLSAGNTIIDNTGITTNGGVTITDAGINAGNKSIANVASGGTTDTNAANIGDVKKAAAAATTKVINADDNVTVTSETAADGSKTYKVGLADSIVLGNDPDKKITLDGTTGTATVGKVNINGHAGTINNLTNRTWNPNAIVNGQAATEDQLKALSDSINTTTSAQTDYSLVENAASADGAYTVTNNQVDLTVKDLKHPNTPAKTVTIKDIASAQDVSKLSDRSVKYDLNPDGTVNKDQVTLAGGPNGTQVSNVASGLGTTDLQDASGDMLKNAVNVGDLQNAINDTSTELTDKGLKFNANSGNEYTAKLGTAVSIKGADKEAGHTYSEKNLTTEIDADGNIKVLMDTAVTADKVTVGQAGPNGKDGSIGVNGKDGSAVVINGKDGSIGAKGADGISGVAINGKDGSIGLTGANGKDATIKVAEDGQPTLDGTPTDRIEVDGHQVATMDDGIKYTGDQGSAAIKLNNTTAIVGGATGPLTDNNIGVVASQDGDNAKLTVKLAKDINLGQNGSVTTGDTKINNDGLTIQNGPSVTKDGINAGDQVVTHVGSGRDGSANEDTNAANIGDVKDISKDAANQAVNNGKYGLKGETGEVQHTINGDSIEVVGDQKAIETKVEGGKLVIAMKPDVNVGGDGKDGSITVKDGAGKDTVTINGKDGSIGLTGANGKDATIKVAEDGQPTLDGTPTDRIEVDGHQVATMDDGIKYTGDQGSAAIKLNNTTAIVGGATGPLTDNNIGVVASQDGDNAKLTVKLAKDINLGQDGSVTTGDTKINNDGLTIQNGPSVTKDGINAGDQVVTHVGSGRDGSANEDTNAANIGDVKDISKDAVNNATFGLTAEDNQAVTNNINKTVKVVGDNQAIETKIDGDKLVVALKDDMNVGQAGPNGKDGSIGVNGKDGSAVVINGKDGSIGAKGADGISGVAINGKDGSIGLTGANGKDATIKVAEDGQPTLDGSPTDRIEVDGHQVATMDDGIKYTGDQGSAAIKLNKNTAIVGGATGSLTDNNIGVVASQDGDNAKLTVKLAKDINLGQDGSLTAGNTTINNGGLTIQNGPSVTQSGINAGDQVVTHVKSGIVNGDASDNTNAANIGDVKAISKDVANQAVDHAVSGLKEDIADAGAHAAALAALKPIQYDPMEPTQIMAGIGGYKGAHALALGVAHYKNESTLFHAGVAVGSHETMYNAGITWKFGNRHEEAAIPDRYKAGPISSVYVMQDEVSAMKAQNTQLLAENKAQKDQLAQQETEMKAMKAQIQMLMEKVGL